MKYIIVVLLIGFILGSCHSSKSIASNETKSISDSLIQKQKDSLAVELAKLQSRYEKLREESKSTGVIFQDPDPCPPIVTIDSSCNRDSLVKVIKNLQSIIRNQSNKLRINADGSIEAEGRIKSAFADAQKLEKDYSELKASYEKVSRTKDSLELKLTKSESTASHSKEKKSGLTWWLFWLGLVLGVLFWNYAGGWIRERFRSR